MTEITAGKTYSGEELEKILGETNERLTVIGNDKFAVIGFDTGNDNLEVAAVVSLTGEA